MSRTGGIRVSGGGGGDRNRCPFCRGTGIVQVDRNEMERNLERFPTLRDRLGLGRSPAGRRYAGHTKLTPWGQVVPVMEPSPLGGGKHMTVRCLHCDGRGFASPPHSSQVGTHQGASKTDTAPAFGPTHQASVKRVSRLAGLAQREESIKRANIELDHTEHSQECSDVPNNIAEQEQEPAPSSEKHIVTGHQADMNQPSDDIIIEALREPGQADTDICDEDTDFDEDIPF